ncbi:AbrB/MazE/SpoVT family DNA-binding domain-containing protein [bacterium]|nr:AbrB/MazE/SpoVT family DNA-binding domain-containing protein [bacterium]
MKGFTMDSVVTTKGQIVIPSKLRRKYGIKSGTIIHFYEGDGEIRIVPITHEMVKSNAGFMGTKGKLLKALMEEKKREREL